MCKKVEINNYMVVTFSIKECFHKMAAIHKTLGLEEFHIYYADKFIVYIGLFTDITLILSV